MPELTIAKSNIASLRKGDVITQIDGKAVGPFIVKGKATLAVIPCEPNGRPVDVNIYPPTNITSGVTITRAIRPVSRTVKGQRFTKQDNGDWRSSSGRYVIRYGYAGMSECDNPHPMGRDGGYCLGGEQHAYNAWQIWDVAEDNYLFDDNHIYDSFRDAASSVPTD